MIDWIRRPDEDLWRSTNLISVNLTGFEAGIALVLHQWSQASFSAHYTYLHASKQSGGFLSNYALDHLSHKFDVTLAFPLRLQLPLLRQGGMRTNLTWQDRAGMELQF